MSEQDSGRLPPSASPVVPPEMAAHLIQLADAKGDLIAGDDGLIVYAPSCGGRGALSPWMLRALADEIDRRNAPWQAELEQFSGEAAA